MRPVVVLLLIAVAACGGRRARHPPAPADLPSEIALHVINHHWLDVTIYVERDGERSRIGLVTAATSQTFIMPGHMVGQSRDIVLVGEAVGSRDMVRTEVLIIKPGQMIEWTLETDLRRSSVGVY